MTLSVDENTPILVAPRPVRIAGAGGAAGYGRRCGTPLRLVSAVADHLERIRINGDNDTDDSKVAFVESGSPDKDLASPRSSPRSSLPSEALEEFLSILKPSSFFPPSSPILRTRRNGASLPTYPYQYRPRVLHSRGDGSLALVEELERSRSGTPTRSPEFMIERNETLGDHERFDSEMPRWLIHGALSSPVNRVHTRNPFQRHPSYEPAGATFSPLSPASIPLPSPGPDEVLEML